MENILYFRQYSGRFQTISNLFFTTTHKLGRVLYSFYTQRNRVRQVERLAQDPTAGQGKNLNSNLGLCYFLEFRT